MKKTITSIYLAWKPIKKWINKLVKGRDDDDNQFNDPYIIF
jgi:hypothetical protein